MGVGEGGDLGQVGDDHDLVVAGQPRQAPADLPGRLPADPGVDLVEDHDRYRVGAGEDDLNGQHYAGELTAGRALVHRPRRGAGVRGEQQRDLVETLGPGIGGVGLDREGDPGTLHGQAGEFRADLGGEAFGGGATPCAELAAQLVDLGAG